MTFFKMALIGAFFGLIFAYLSRAIPKGSPAIVFLGLCSGASTLLLGWWLGYIPGTEREKYRTLIIDMYGDYLERAKETNRFEVPALREAYWEQWVDFVFGPPDPWSEE